MQYKKKRTENNEMNVSTSLFNRNIYVESKAVKFVRGH